MRESAGQIFSPLRHNERHAQRRVDVTNDDDPVRPRFEQHGLEAMGVRVLPGASDPGTGAPGLNHVLEAPNGLRAASIYLYEASVTATETARPDVHRCMLFTDTANPVSNSIYRQIGYVPRGEHVEIAFDA